MLVVTMSVKSQNLFVGTYTDGTSQGVYAYDFNSDTGVISNKTLQVKTAQPSFITFGASKEIMYAVNELEDGKVSVFIKEGDIFKLVQEKSTFGAHPCHITYLESGYVSISNYTGGNVVIYGLDKNGLLKEEPQVFDQNTSDVKAHAHFSKFVNGDLLVSDLGRNRIFKYIGQTDKLQPAVPLAEWSINAGPRHFDTHGNFLYAISEYANTIDVFDLNGKHLQKISTLREGFKGDSYCADIHVSKDGNYVFGSNRGENSIVIFKRGENGLLNYHSTYDVKGDWPRNFTMDPSGKWLLVANQKSDNISVFRIDNSGKMEFKNSYSIGAPVCLVF